MGARVALEPNAETLYASATVRVTPLAGQRAEVTINWTLVDPFGIKIGRIKQSSPFTRSIIENSWGELAQEAGLAAAAGMANLVAQIDWRYGFVVPDGGTSKKRMRVMSARDGNPNASKSSGLSPAE